MTPPPYPPFTGFEPCATTDPEIFYPEKGKSGPHPSKAKALCRSCDLISECQEWAVWFEEDGIWGATSGKERMEIRRRRGIVRQTPSRPSAA